MGQFPNLASVIEDFVLSVVGCEILLDKEVIDNGWLDRFLILLNLALFLQFVLNMLLHGFHS